MKKTLLLVVVVMTSFVTLNLYAQVKIGLKVGVDFSNLKMDYNGDSFNDEMDTKRLISPRFGPIVELPVNDFLFVQAGLFGTAKGLRYQDEWLETTTKYIEILGTVDIPINFGYKYDLGNVKLFGMAGPVISYNIYTTLLYKEDGEDWDNDNDNTIGTSDEDIYKPLNFGVNIEAGVELNRFQFSAFYNAGLANITNYDQLDIKTSVFGLTAAVKFGSVN